MAKEKTVQQKEAHVNKRANSFLTVLGVAADITAIAALVFSKNLALFVQIMSVAGVAVGLYLLFHHWGKPVGARVLFATACITAGCVVGALSLVSGAQPAATANGNAPDSANSQQAGQNNDDTGSSNSSVAFQFRLEPYQGIDFDTGKHAQSDVVDTDGPNGNVDVFLTQFGYLVVNNGSFYIDTGGPDNEIHSRCTKALAAQRNPMTQVLPQKNVQICFKTSAGKTGWLRGNDTALNSQIYAVLNVQIWQ